MKNGSRAIRGRVFPEYVCIEDVDKIISSVQRAPEEAAGRGETGKHLTASETRFTPIDRLTASAMNGKGPACSAAQSDGPLVTLYLRGPSPLASNTARSVRELRAPRGHHVKQLSRLQTHTADF